ncbi:sulfate adenylyltransferase subunit CysN [Pseudomonadales bacterium]|nr:sulfate adenylyltransferase subunit CysN [Pseudomonadales bacterium]MDA8949901.1 sulfate adenylyltransferase subunit CysN [Pseudomonadales bacterium]
MKALLSTDSLEQSEKIDAYLAAQSQLDLLRFITCGSVDDGKSTLIGRMLYEAQLIFEDQVTALQTDSKKMGTQGGDIDFALLVDGLAAEREQGITIDVAYRFFNTDKRKFIVADTPGHEQYTRNMVTGASTVDVAIILVDASQGILTQTRRHSFIASLLGIEHVVLAVNKMDLMDYASAPFEAICDEYEALRTHFAFKSVTPIPMSALKGDNVIERSGQMSWYQGPTLLGFLETVDIRARLTQHGFRLPVQWVNRPNADFRGFSGTVVAGSIRPGDAIRALPSGQLATVERVVLFDQDLDQALTDQAVTLTLDTEIDLSRGDLIVSADSPCEVSDQFEAELVWMDQDPGYIGRSYRLQLGTSQVNASLSSIKFRYDVNTFEHLTGRSLTLNEIANVQITLDTAIPFEAYADCPALGAFVLIDRYSNATVAAGMIRFALRRASNVHRQALSIDRPAREKMAGHRGRVVWLTGLSGAGKSTIASAAEQLLHDQGLRTYILDGDNVRHGLSKDLGFTVADRVENIRRIAEVAKLMVDAGVIVLTAFISPFRAERDMAKSLFTPEDFLEIFVDTSLAVAEARDPKGLYKKARRGELPNFTGIDSDYEPPLQPDLRLNTGDRSVEDCAKALAEVIMTRATD